MATNPKNAKSKKVAKVSAPAKPQTKKPAATASKPATKKPAAKALPAKSKPAVPKTPVKKPATKTRAAAAPAAETRAVNPLRNPNFPTTYIQEISVSLDDPDHWVKLTWTGPKAAQQDAGPFRGCPGAGKKGLNCDITATSRKSGSYCTPKGTYLVEGFARRLNSDSRAEYVTWFVRSRGIAFHYFPTVPNYAASHGCVRLESKRVAQLIKDNSRVDKTKVVIGGTWTKPPKQW